MPEAEMPVPQLNLTNYDLVAEDTWCALLAGIVYPLIHLDVALLGVCVARASEWLCCSRKRVTERVVLLSVAEMPGAAMPVALSRVCVTPASEWLRELYSLWLKCLGLLCLLSAVEAQPCDLVAAGCCVGTSGLLGWSFPCAQLRCLCFCLWMSVEAVGAHVL